MSKDHWPHNQNDWQGRDQAQAMEGRVPRLPVPRADILWCIEAINDDGTSTPLVKKNRIATWDDRRDAAALADILRASGVQAVVIRYDPCMEMQPTEAELHDDVKHGLEGD